MSIGWESTTLLRVADTAYIRTEVQPDGREARELVECPRCHRITDWLLTVGDGSVEVTCRCGSHWQLTTTLDEVLALAECPPTDPGWTCLDDARAALGFDEQRRTRRWLRHQSGAAVPAVFPGAH